MKNQVTSIEQSERLIELGVPAERASMVYRKTNIVGIVRLEVKKGKGGVVAPAFTVADLLAVLPKKIMTNGGKVHILHIEACSSTSPCWCLYWGDEATQVGWQERISFLHLLEDAIEWLCLNGYKLNL